MKSTIKPRGKWVLVKQEEPDSKVQGNGLIIPPSEEKEQKARGVVEAVGNDPSLKDIKKGDHVIFGAYAGEKMEVKEGNKKTMFLLLHDDDIIAFIK